MYRCGLCGKCSEPGQARRTVVVTRHVPAGTQAHPVRRDGGTYLRYVQTPPRTEIAREIPVCPGCEEGVEETLVQSSPAIPPVLSGRVVKTVRPK